MVSIGATKNMDITPIYEKATKTLYNADNKMDKDNHLPAQMVADLKIMIGELNLLEDLTEKEQDIVNKLITVTKKILNAHYNNQALKDLEITETEDGYHVRTTDGSKLF